MRHLLIVFLLFVASPSFCQLSGKVVAISDGDTFTLLTASKKQVKIRLYGIDCPESKQDFGNVAKKFLSGLIFNKAVNVKEMNTDRYGRTIGIVSIGSININEMLLSAGMAWHYRKYDKSKKWDMLEETSQKEQERVMGKFKSNCSVGISAIQKSCSQMMQQPLIDEVPYQFDSSKGPIKSILALIHLRD